MGDWPLFPYDPMQDPSRTRTSMCECGHPMGAHRNNVGRCAHEDGHGSGRPCICPSFEPAVLYAMEDDHSHV